MLAKIFILFLKNDFSRRKKSSKSDFWRRPFSRRPTYRNRQIVFFDQGFLFNHLNGGRRNLQRVSFERPLAQVAGTTQRSFLTKDTLITRCGTGPPFVIGKVDCLAFGATMRQHDSFCFTEHRPLQLQSLSVFSSAELFAPYKSDQPG